MVGQFEFLAYCVTIQKIETDPLPVLGELRMKRVSKWIAVTAVLLGASAAFGQGRGQARSMVISRNGIVASESPLASQAGAHILENGGNAADAAVATKAQMGGAEPVVKGPGG